jgi:phenylalanyl-tRNA synthetase beta chain
VETAKLAEDLTLVGLAVDGVERDGDETVLDLDITTNRVDCMNVYGVAREVSTLYRTPLRPPDVSFQEAGAPASEALQVSIEAPDLCPRFCARVLDVRLGPSPAWLRDRLERVGVRPINNVVDLTNYVMMELGHPSHAFDLSRIPGQRLVVRWAREGERLVTLDAVERTLHARVGVVAGPDQPLALAGIMGGAASEVADETRVVALEAAWWDPLSVRRAARSLGMHTEASHRFERGADPDEPPRATARIAHLLEKIGAGRARPGLIDAHPAPRARRRVVLRPQRARALLGAEVAEAEVDRILGALGFGVAREDGRVAAEVPSWRGDVAREADLVEEVGRHFGLNRIPGTVPPARGAEGLRGWQVRERRVRDVLAGFGLNEAITYSFVAEAGQRVHGEAAVRLANPLSEEQNVLRTSLAVPGLLACLAANVRQGRSEARLFELGRVFLPSEGSVREERRVALLLHGRRAPAHWSSRGPDADFHDVAGLLEGLVRRLGHPEPALDAAGAPAFLHPGRAAVVRLRGEAIGWLGTLHPEVARRWDLLGEVQLAEVALDPLLAAPPPVRTEPLARFPPVARDLSVVCEAGLPAARLRQVALAEGGPLLRAADVTDRYEGAPIPAGKVALTLSLRFQHGDRTLTGEEVQAAVDHLAGALARAGATIRSE